MDSKERYEFRSRRNHS